MKPTSLWQLSAILFAFAVFTVSCSDDGEEDTVEGAEQEVTGECETDDPTGDLDTVDFSDMSLNVGSKDFAEQIVLGEMLIQVLEAYGADVADNTNFGGTGFTREAMIDGEIDTYFEYNGTGWAVHLGREIPSPDPEELTEDVCIVDLEENNVRWIGRSALDSTYGFATGPDFLDGGEPFTLQSMADHLETNADATICVEAGFSNQPDGLVLFEEATGYEVPESQINVMENSVIYEETALGNCEFGEVYTTDGRIPGLDLNLVVDPGVFISYNASLTMLDDVYQQAPESWDAVATAILEPLDNETMIELTERVTLGREDAADVANEFLTEVGIV